MGIDLDEVLFNTVEAWIERHNDITDDYVKVEDIKSWEIARYIHKGNKETLFYILRQNDFWQTVKPVTGSVSYLSQLQRNYDDIEICIVTASDFNTLPNKMRRFFELFPFINRDQVVVTYQKNLINVDVMVDDNPNNLKNMPKGCVKVLFDAPHNRSCNEEDIAAIRVKSWDELYKLIVVLSWLEGDDE